MTKKITLLSLLFLFATTIYAQKKETESVKKATYTDSEDLRRQQKLLGIDTLYYVDSTFGYKVKIPKWLKILDSGSDYAWGGTLPAVSGIENAIIIKSFDKKEYKSLKAFREFIVEDLKFGETPTWSNSHQFMGKKEIDDFKTIGKSYKVYMMRKKLIYHCCYLFCETNTAYLWIDFTATPETYDKNFKKLKEFVTGFSILK